MLRWTMSTVSSAYYWMLVGYTTVAFALALAALVLVATGRARKPANIDMRAFEQLMAAIGAERRLPKVD
jgi:hypothetical protein